MRLVIELTENRQLNVYCDTDVEITVIDWQEIKEDCADLPSWSKNNPIVEAGKELLHKTTGLKRVY